MKQFKYDDIKNAQYEQVQSEEKLPIKIIKIDINEDLENNQVPKHWHRSLEIIVPKLGGTEVWVEGKLYEVKVGDFFVINSKEIHACRSLMPQGSYKGYVIQIKYDFLKECFNNIDYFFFEHFSSELSRRKIISIMDEMIKFEEINDNFKLLKQKSLVYELIYELLQHQSIPKNDQYLIHSGKQKNKLVEILTYLDDIADEVFDANAIAAHFHLSYGYLANLFKTYLHMSMKEYVDSVRIKKAERDLMMTDLSILEIALAHGYANTKSFYREFKKYYHMTPNEYRKHEKMTQVTSF